MTPDFNKLSKKELVTLLETLHTELSTMSDEAEKASEVYYGERNYAYAFGYVTTLIENSVGTLNRFGQS